MNNEILVSEVPSLGGWRDTSMVDQKVKQAYNMVLLKVLNGSESDPSNVIAPSFCIFLILRQQMHEGNMGRKRDQK